MGGSQNSGYIFWGVPIIRTMVFFESILGSPYFGKYHIQEFYTGIGLAHRV